ncbi:MAG: hypothetical protein WD623_16120 [Marinobacter sp.]|uniref:hypothetical protein n=1 Tax=Marinobacter sp. TaxID=50741 RepID=UPI0034A08201
MKDKAKSSDAGDNQLHAMNDLIAELIEAEGLPDHFRSTVERYFVPLAEEIAKRQRLLGQPMLVGINGAQGTGKSTLALFLQNMLTSQLNCPCARFSLDDLYRTHTDREWLARKIHPLLATRGVPGTHDLVLGQQTVNQLINAGPTTETRIPVFDKAIDDRLPHSRWPIYTGVANVILIEGWCVGAQPEEDSAKLAAPVNSLESEEDPEGIWREYVNIQLKGPYADFFGQLDMLIMLKAPSMECVLKWRTLQERKLANKRENAPEKRKNESSSTGTDHCPSQKDQSRGIMSADDLIRFIMHYERLTLAMLQTMPARADAVLDVAEDHKITGLHWRE